MPLVIKKTFSITFKFDFVPSQELDEDNPFDTGFILKTAPRV